MMFNILKSVALLFIATILSSCALFTSTKYYEESYKQVAAKQYPENSNARLFDYGDSDLAKIYETLFSDYLIIGYSSFQSTKKIEPKDVLKLAKAKGAEIVISGRIFVTKVEEMEPRTSYSSPSSSAITDIVNMDKSDPSTPPVSVNTSRDSFVTITKDVFRYDALFLQNVNNVRTIQQKKEADFLCGSSSEYDGVWQRLGNRFRVCTDKEYIIGFVRILGDKGLPKTQEPKKSGIPKEMVDEYPTAYDLIKSAVVTNDGSSKSSKGSYVVDKNEQFNWHDGDVAFMLSKTKEKPSIALGEKDKQPFLVDYKIDKFGNLSIEIISQKPIKDIMLFERL